MSWTRQAGGRQGVRSLTHLLSHAGPSGDFHDGHTVREHPVDEAAERPNVHLGKASKLARVARDPWVAATLRLPNGRVH